MHSLSHTHTCVLYCVCPSGSTRASCCAIWASPRRPHTRTRKPPGNHSNHSKATISTTTMKQTARPTRVDLMVLVAAVVWAMVCGPSRYRPSKATSGGRGRCPHQVCVCGWMDVCVHRPALRLHSLFRLSRGCVRTCVCVYGHTTNTRMHVCVFMPQRRGTEL